MRVETIAVGSELAASAPARLGPVQLTLDDAPHRQPTQLDGRTKAMWWLHMYGPARLDDLRRFTRLVGDILDASGRGDTAAALAADRQLTDAGLEWEPVVTLDDIDAAVGLHRSADCSDCWPSTPDKPTGDTMDTERRNRCRRIGCPTPATVIVHVEGVRPEAWCDDHAEEVIAVAQPLNPRTEPLSPEQPLHVTEDLP